MANNNWGENADSDDSPEQKERYREAVNSLIRTKIREAAKSAVKDNTTFNELCSNIIRSLSIRYDINQEAIRTECYKRYKEESESSKSTIRSRL